MDSFKVLVVTRILARILVLRLPTLFMDLASLARGFFAKHFNSQCRAALQRLNLKKRGVGNFIPPTLKACILGCIVGIRRQ
jgi:ABC-type transporter Mla maintaining outer membrane lipid asymmetry permease subunit MlaE